MQPCLIAIDIDGTLLTSQGKVTPRTREALHLAQAAGIEVVIATGRRHAYAMRVLRELQLCETNALVSSNGTVIRSVGAELIRREHLSLEAARRLCQIARPFRDALVFTFDNIGPDGEDRRGALVLENTHSLQGNIDAWMRANEPYIAQVEDLEAIFSEDPSHPNGAASGSIKSVGDAERFSVGDGPIQAMLCGTVARMAEAERVLTSDPAIAGVNQSSGPGCEIVLHRTSYPERDLAIIDILPAGCSKASALAQLASLRGCTMADVVAIGDNWNDLAMLQEAGRPILMANAPAELRALARERGWHIGPTNDEEGVAEAIEAILAPALDIPVLA